MKLGYFSRETMVGLRRNPLMTVAGVLTVAVSLFHFGGVMLLSRMAENGTSKWKDGIELEIFFFPGATEEQIGAVRQALEQAPDVRRFRFLSKEDAFGEAKRLFAREPDLVENVDPAALPPSFRVAPAQAEQTETIAARFRGQAAQEQLGVKDVATAKRELRAFLAGIRWVRRLFLVVAGVLLASSLLLIVNTISLATFARRREIQVMKLVGATNWFIRVPFMFEGLLQGAMGAAIAAGGVYFVQGVAASTTADASNVFESFYATSSDALTIGIVIVLVGAAVGALGSVIGLRRSLRI